MHYKKSRQNDVIPEKKKKKKGGKLKVPFSTRHLLKIVAFSLEKDITRARFSLNDYNCYPKKKKKHSFPYVV
jgi:hypothetical protein